MENASCCYDYSEKNMRICCVDGFRFFCCTCILHCLQKGIPSVGRNICWFIYYINTCYLQRIYIRVWNDCTAKKLHSSKLQLTEKLCNSDESRRRQTGWNFLWWDSWLKSLKAEPNMCHTKNCGPERNDLFLWVVIDYCHWTLHQVAGPESASLMHRVHLTNCPSGMKCLAFTHSLLPPSFIQTTPQFVRTNILSVFRSESHNKRNWKLLTLLLKRSGQCFHRVFCVCVCVFTVCVCSHTTTTQSVWVISSHHTILNRNFNHKTIFTVSVFANHGHA